MNYWDLRERVSKIVPRSVPFQALSTKRSSRPVREKGRKKQYSEFDLMNQEWVRQERLLNTQVINSFVEISCRAAACPMPLNIDVWDGLLCPFGCKYCVTGDTLITMADGSSIPIQQLKPGDEVLSFNPTTESLVSDSVQELMFRKSPILVLKTSKGDIRITSNHEVFTQNGWIEAGKLTRHDFLLVFSPSEHYIQEHEQRTYEKQQSDEESCDKGKSIHCHEKMVGRTSRSTGSFVQKKKGEETSSFIDENPKENFSTDEAKQSYEKRSLQKEDGQSMEGEDGQSKLHSSQQRKKKTRCKKTDVGSETESNEKSRNIEIGLDERSRKSEARIPWSEKIVPNLRYDGDPIRTREAFSVACREPQKGNPRGCLPSPISGSDRIRRILDSPKQTRKEVGSDEGQLFVENLWNPNPSDSQGQSFQYGGLSRGHPKIPQDKNLQWIEILEIQTSAEVHTVYNIETRTFHNYFAGGFLVHNCYANAFRASLYTAFFDNSKEMGFRHCNPKVYRKEMDKLLKLRGKDPHDISGDVSKAIAMSIPLRFGIRFEDFLKEEAKQGISLSLLEHLADHHYPVMINTKSVLVGEDRYVQAMARNKGRAAVHITLITSNERLLKELEPGAPSYSERIQVMRTLSQAGIRVVARIEPYLPFLGDHPDDVARYMEDLKNAGVRHITFDTYSYTAKNPGIAQSFQNLGIDFDRVLLVGCDSQALGSLMLGSFMQMFRDEGFSCSTFDMGNVPDNNQSVCCEVGDWFQGGFNRGCTVYAARFIRHRRSKPTSWEHFSNWVNKGGGFLSASLEKEVHQLWNYTGNDAYSSGWARGMEAVGYDQDGIVWSWKDSDFREDILKETENE